MGSVENSTSYDILKKTRKAGDYMRKSNDITDEQVVRRANAAVRIELEKNNALEVPSIIYDRKTQSICQLNADGSKTLLTKSQRGRYSERCAKQK